MSDPMEVLNLLKAARLERREDLQSVIDSHIGTTAASVLILNQARMNAHFLGIDPNTEVDVPGESTSGLDRFLQESS